MSTNATHHGTGVKVQQFAEWDIGEKLGEKEANAAVQEVTLAPGQEVLPHTHAGPVFGYVLEGEYEHALNNGPVRILKTGDAFYEPSGCVHRVTKNPSGTGQVRLLAVILYSRDAMELTIPMKSNRIEDFP